jgi:gliding motility-associated-like protein
MFDTAGDHIVQLIAKNSIGCMDTAIIEVEGITDSLEFDIDYTIACQDSLSTFDVNLDYAIDSIVWDMGDSSTFTIEDDTAFYYAYQDPQSSIVTAMVYSGACNQREDVSVTIPGFAAFINRADTTIFNDDTLMISTNGDPSFEYEWFPSDVFDDNTIMDQVITGEVSMTYTLLITDPSTGCKAVDTIQVLVKEGRLVEQASSFSPNGDSDNEEFIIQGKGICNVHMKVFDRWGKFLFESENQSQGWNGKTPTGEYLPNDIYVYHLFVTFCDGRTGNFQGTVTIIR